MGKGKIIISADLISTLKSQNLRGEQLSETGLQFIRRKVEEGSYYYVVNHTSQNIDDYFKLNNNAQSLILLDPQTGDYGKPAINQHSNTISTRLQLKPGESMVIKLSNKVINAPEWKYLSNTTATINIDRNWKLNFISGGPALPPSRNLKSLQLWSDFTDSSYKNFSGTGVYSTTFDLSKKAGKEYLLQLNELYETASIKINGKQAGYIYSVPYELRIGKYLKQGNNKIEIEVSNLMANRISYMDRNKMVWRNYHEINFVNKDYKEFNASGWQTMPSGLAGPVSILEF